MKSAFFLSFVAALLCGSLLAADKRSIRPQIVGGDPAQEGEFPYVVSLQEYGDHYCAGTLIAPDWVLTAAHCARDLSDTEAVLGSVWVGDPTEGERYTIAEVLIHPAYRSGISNDFDFALLKLNRPSRLTPLTPRWDFLPVQEGATIQATIAGWGATRENGIISLNLQKAEVPLVTQERCAQAYPGKITDRMICAGYESGGKDACKKDSGGPLVLVDGPESALIGVISFGIGCARPGFFGVYGRVSSVADWIRAAISR